MFTASDLELLRYLIASAYVVLPALLLLLCAALARVPVQLHVDEPSDDSAVYVALRDVYASFAIAMVLECRYHASSKRYIRAIRALYLAFCYRWHAMHYHEAVM